MFNFLKSKEKENDFDEKFYLNYYQDVANAVKLGVFRDGYDHYFKFGKLERRFKNQSLVQDSRENCVFKLIDKGGIGLEIGPSHNPIAPKSSGFNVEIVDHLSAEELKEKYKTHGVNINNIESVDFVWRGEPLVELIGMVERYDYIIASHVIEHIPDPVSFLQNCEKLLKPNGVLSFVVPDKRYCFDYFQPLSLTGSLIDAYLEKRIRPSSGQIFDHYSNASTRRGQIAWSKLDESPDADEIAHQLHEAITFYEKSKESAIYIDVHCWRFTPESFSLILGDLNALGLNRLQINYMSTTNGCEFYVSIKKNNFKSDFQTKKSRIDLLRSIKLGL